MAEDALSLRHALVALLSRGVPTDEANAVPVERLKGIASRWSRGMRPGPQETLLLLDTVISELPPATKQRLVQRSDRFHMSVWEDDRLATISKRVGQCVLAVLDEVSDHGQQAGMPASAVSTLAGELTLAGYVGLDAAHGGFAVDAGAPWVALYKWLAPTGRDERSHARAPSTRDRASASMSDADARSVGRQSGVVRPYTRRSTVSFVEDPFNNPDGDAISHPATSTGCSVGATHIGRGDGAGQRRSKSHATAERSARSPTPYMPLMAGSASAPSRWSEAQQLTVDEWRGAHRLRYGFDGDSDVDDIAATRVGQALFAMFPTYALHAHVCRVDAEAIIVFAPAAGLADPSFAAHLSALPEFAADFEASRVVDLPPAAAPPPPPQQQQQQQQGGESSANRRRQPQPPRWATLKGYDMNARIVIVVAACSHKHTASETCAVLDEILRWCVDQRVASVALPVGGELLAFSPLLGAALVACALRFAFAASRAAAAPTNLPVLRFAFCHPVGGAAERLVALSERWYLHKRGAVVSPTVVADVGDVNTGSDLASSTSCADCAPIIHEMSKQLSHYSAMCPRSASSSSSRRGVVEHCFTSDEAAAFESAWAVPRRDHERGRTDEPRPSVVGRSGWGGLAVLVAVVLLKTLSTLL